jgi:hypothetical protein
VDVRHERIVRWSSQTPEARAKSSAADYIYSPSPGAGSSNAIIHVGRAVAVVGGLAALGELIAFLVNLELYLPRRVRESVALGLVGMLLLILAVWACCVLSLAGAH